MSIPNQGWQIIGMTQLRVCSDCGFELSIGRFSENKSARDGLNARCKSCDTAYHRLRSMYKRRTDSTFRLHENIRSGLHNSLRGKTKSKRTLEILGLESWEQLEAHLNDNLDGYVYGDENVDIDHRRPQSWFNNPEEAWHYTNLQLADSFWNRHIKRDRFET